jgi:AcrR family transcriptional regulator
MPTPAPPTAQERRKQQRTARRDAILAAARKVFAHKGFDGSTIADIAREAGVAAGTVYLYYASKIDLFAALNAQLYEVINTAIRDAEAPPDLAAGTRARVRAVFEACSRHRDVLRLIFLNPDPRTEVARRMKHADEQRLRPLADLFSGGMAAGVVRREDPALLARLVTGAVTIALYQCFVQADGRDQETYEALVSDMIVGGLTP